MKRKLGERWRFLEFHFDTNVLARWNDHYNRLPTMKDAAASPLYLGNNPYRKVQTEVAAYSQRIPAIIPIAAQIQPPIVELVQNVLTGQAGPQQALDEGARLIQAELDRWWAQQPRR